MTEKPSLAREFYERIVGASDPLVAIRKLYDPADPQFETDYLDFKNYDPKSLKGQFRQALCGFSNNQGGVLLWGIDARPVGHPPIDAACGESPLPDPVAIKSRLLELQNGSVDPPAANIEVEAIETAPGSGLGFVIAYIPDGPIKPYRCTDGLQPFWFRSGWSFVPMPTSMVRQLFYPKSQALFRVVGDVHTSMTIRRPKDLVSEKKPFLVAMELSLENIGSGTAANTFIQLRVATQAEFDPEIVAGEDWKINASNAPVYLFQGLSRIHPQQLSHLFSLNWDIPTGQSADEYLGASLQVRMIVYCENQEPQKFFTEIDATDLEDGPSLQLNLQPVEELPLWPDE